MFSLNTLVLRRQSLCAASALSVLSLEQSVREYWPFKSEYHPASDAICYEVEVVTHPASGLVICKNSTL